MPLALDWLFRMVGLCGKSWRVSASLCECLRYCSSYFLGELAFLEAAEVWVFTVCKAGEDTWGVCCSQINFVLLLVVFYYLNIVANLLFQFEYEVFHLKKLLSVDFCWDNCLLFLVLLTLYRVANRSGLSVSYDFLINCPILRQDVPSAGHMGIRWKESPGFNVDGYNWSKDYSCLLLLDVSE